MKDILCVGMANVDVVATPVDRFNPDGDTTYAQSIGMTVGGDALNTAIRLNKMGCKVSFVCTLGNDTAGDFILSQMNGIDTRGVKRTNECQSAVCMVLVESNGQRKFVYNPGSNRLISNADVTDEMLDNACVLHVGGVMQLTSLDIQLATLFKRAHEKGVATCMDLTCDTDGKWLEKIDDALNYTDYFLPSIDEAQKLSGEKTPQQMRRFFEKYGLKALVIKLGKEGCYVTDFKNETYLSCYPATTVDTTGAGDSFVAGFLAGITSGENCFFSAAVGNVTASVCVGSKTSTGGEISYDTAKENCLNYYNCEYFRSDKLGKEQI